MCCGVVAAVRDDAAAVSCGRPVWLTEGDTLYLRWQSDLGPLNRCAAVLPGGTEVVLPDGGAAVAAAAAADGDGAGAAYAYVGDGYRSGQCGLRTDNVTAGVGDWTLVAAAAADGRRDRYTSRVTCIGKRDNIFGLLCPHARVTRAATRCRLSLTHGDVVSIAVRVARATIESGRRRRSLTTPFRYDNATT